MNLLIFAGLLYLSGISTILLLKPDIMFSKDGNWKEFGIGRNPATHTWMPFWLFAIMWAIVSYILSLILVRAFFSSPTNSPSINSSPTNSSVNVSKRNRKSKNIVFEEVEQAHAYMIITKPAIRII
jgi:hypothetical protein